MRKIKALISFACALIATLALAVPALAAEGHTITIISETGGHTYVAYQIFSGDYDDTVDNTPTLSNVEWGSGVNDDVLGAIQQDQAIGDYFSNCKSATDVAKVLENAVDSTGAKVFQTDSDAIDAFAAIVAKHVKGNGTSSVLTPDSTYTYTISGLGDGYYIIIEDDLDEDSTAANAYSKFMVQLLGNVTVESKADVPTITKQVTDVNDSTGVSTVGDSADYDCGDVVPFTITANVAANYDDYAAYRFVIHDTLAAGFALDSNSVKVSVGDTPITSGYDVVTTGLSDGCTLEVKFADLKNIASVKADSAIKVEYNATLLNTATVGGAGNDNTATLEYSNDPRDVTGGRTAKTVSDTVTVFTYQVIINKVDEKQSALDGAAFRLEKKIKGANGAEDTWDTVEEIAAADDKTQFTFDGLDDGTYRLTETTTPAGYNTMDPVEFTIAAEHEIGATGSQITALTGSATDGAPKFTPDVSAGSLTASVVNLRGATLPSTGGIGKTVLITAGAILAVVAGVGLVAKFRASRMK